MGSLDRVEHALTSTYDLDGVVGPCLAARAGCCDRSGLVPSQPNIFLVLRTKISPPYVHPRVLTCHLPSHNHSPVQGKVVRSCVDAPVTGKDAVQIATSYWCLPAEYVRMLVLFCEMYSMPVIAYSPNNKRQGKFG
jgi:hypothetical protein